MVGCKIICVHFFLNDIVDIIENKMNTDNFVARLKQKVETVLWERSLANCIAVIIGDLSQITLWLYGDYLEFWLSAVTLPELPTAAGCSVKNHPWENPISFDSATFTLISRQIFHVYFDKGRIFSVISFNLLNEMWQNSHFIKLGSLV